MNGGELSKVDKGDVRSPMQSGPAESLFSAPFPLCLWFPYWHCCFLWCTQMEVANAGCAFTMFAWWCHHPLHKFWYLSYRTYTEFLWSRRGSFFSFQFLHLWVSTTPIVELRPLWSCLCWRQPLPPFSDVDPWELLPLVGFFSVISLDSFSSFQVVLFYVFHRIQQMWNSSKVDKRLAVSVLTPYSLSLFTFAHIIIWPLWSETGCVTGHTIAFLFLTMCLYSPPPLPSMTELL